MSVILGLGNTRPGILTPKRYEFKQITPPGGCVPSAREHYRLSGITSLILDVRPSFATTAPGSLCVEKEQCTRMECRVPHHVSFSSNTDLWGICVSGNSFTTQTCMATIGSRLFFGKRMVDEWWGKKSFALGGTALRESQVEASGTKPIMRFS